MCLNVTITDGNGKMRNVISKGVEKKKENDDSKEGEKRRKAERERKERVGKRRGKRKAKELERKGEDNPKLIRKRELSESRGRGGVDS